MYKIILIDDEDEVREGIKRKTNWTSCGFELVGDFVNGRDALESMEQLQPDIVITDICMPFMDGLELAERIAEQYRDVVVVIVTGYEDFEYAKQAIKLKVKDYLLKPVNSQEFTAFLLKMKQELDDARAKREDLSQLKLQLNQSLPLLKERFLERMAVSRMKKEEIERKFRYFCLSLPGPAYTAIVGDIDDFKRDSYEDQESEIELLRFAAFNIIQEIFEQEGGIVFRTRDEKIAILYSGDPGLIPLIVQKLTGHAKHSVEKVLNMSFSMGIGRTYPELQQLSQSFQEANSALDYRFLLGKSQIISISDLEFGKSFNSIKYNEWEKKLLSAMKTGSVPKAAQYLKEGIDDLRKSVSSIDQCYGTFYKLLVALMNMVSEAGFDHSDLFADNPFSKLTSMKTLNEVQTWLEHQCEQIICYLAAKRTDVTQSQMKQAETFIRDHYNDESFSLQHVCNHIYMSMSYFSAQFKLHTGETFVEYLTRTRLEKAKELLSITQLKTYDIAARVGYSDPQYFSVIFKRNTGMTPKEYRARKGSGSI
ncbi:response regulator transcription factor [Paenibacillus sp. UNC451MF]|uniref:response regulator transcription factor n=1 Tax=Paenibacillus sp. UNC451MF TaxID=1449063 RepID=UPI00048CBB7A|nr:response regulator [Paenibacillus sp. UNC451MF]